MDPAAWLQKHRTLSNIAHERDKAPRPDYYSDQFIHQVHNLLTVDGTTAASRCAHSLALNALRAADTELAIDDLCGDIYYAIMSAATELGSDQRFSERLADLVYELSQLPPAKVPKGDGPRERKRNRGILVKAAWDERTQKYGKVVPPDQVIKWGGQMLWRDLPGFGPMMVNRKSCHHGGCIPAAAERFQSFPWPDGSRVEHRWLGYNTFVATFVARYADTSEVAACYRWYGISAISDALEHSPKNGYRGWRAVPAACVWLEIAATQVAGLIETNEVCAAGPLWEDAKDSAKLTPGRWRFWGEALRRYMNDERLVSERERMERALSSWENVEVAD